MIWILLSVLVGLACGAVGLYMLAKFERPHVRPRGRRRAMLAMAMALVLAMIGSEAKAHGPRNIQFGLGFGRPIVSFPSRSFSSQRFGSFRGHGNGVIVDDFGRVFARDSFGRFRQIR